MKTQISQSLKQVFSDRTLVTLLIVFVITCLAYVTYVVLSLHISDVLVGIRYTAFGETHYYRERWYYLLSFIGFGILVGFVHTTIAIKLYLQERRQLALLFIYLSLFFMLITWIITHAVLAVAFPS